MFQNEWTKRAGAALAGAILVLVAVLLMAGGATGDTDGTGQDSAESADPTAPGGGDDPATDVDEAAPSGGASVVRVVGNGGPSSSPSNPAPAPAPSPTPSPSPAPAADNETPVLHHDSITRHGYIVQVRGIAEDPDGAITHFTVDWGDGLVETFAPYFNEGYQKPGMKASRNFDPAKVADTSLTVVVKVYDDQGAYVAFTETVNF